VADTAFKAAESGNPAAIQKRTSPSIKGLNFQLPALAEKLNKNRSKLSYLNLREKQRYAGKDSASEVKQHELEDLRQATQSPRYLANPDYMVEQPK